MAINKLVIPDSVNTIEDYAFKNSTNLSKVVVGGGAITSLDSIIAALRNKGFSLSGNAFNGISKIHTTHSFSYTITKAATCTAAGSKTGTCTCGNTDTQTIAATGHSYGSWVTTASATCTTNGNRKKTCSNCGDIVTETITATGHSYGDWVVSSDGNTKTRTCSKCGNKETVSNKVDLKNASADVKAKYNFLGTTNTVNYGRVQVGATNIGGASGAPVPVYGHYTELGSTGTSRFDSSNNTCKECIIYLSKAATLCSVTYKVGYYKLNKLDPSWWITTSGNSKNFLHMWTGLAENTTTSWPEYTYLGSTYSVANAV